MTARLHFPIGPGQGFVGPAQGFGREPGLSLGPEAGPVLGDLRLDGVRVGLLLALAPPRLGLLVPRLAAAGPDSDLARIDTLAALRIGMNLVSLRRARHGLAPQAVAPLDEALDAVAAHYEGPRGPASETLLHRIDAALTRIEAEPGGDDARRDALLGLVGLRRALFPEAPPPGAVLLAREAA